jgi:hypothetical protein
MANLIESPLIEKTNIRITQEQTGEIGDALSNLKGVSIEIDKNNGIKQILSFEIGEENV